MSRDDADLLASNLNERRLPRWGVISIGVIATGVAVGILLLTDAFGIPALVVLGFVLHVVLTLIISASYEGVRWAKDRIATLLVVGAFALAMIPLLSVAFVAIRRGIDRLIHPYFGYFWNYSMRGVFGGTDAGGIAHAVQGTLLVTLFACLISIPIGLLTSIYLVEYGGGKLAKAITFFVDVMTGIPSIVAGLFAFALFSLIFGPGIRIGIMGSVALSVLMIPIVVRSSEEMLRLVPNELREASYALGVPKWLTILRIVLRIVLRTAIAGIVTGIMLAVARVIGETAPLLLTVGVVDSLNGNMFSGRVMTLPVYVYRQYAQGFVPCLKNTTPDVGIAQVQGIVQCIPTINLDRAWAAALTLILIVMVLNLLARLVSKFFSPKTLP